MHKWRAVGAGVLAVTLVGDVAAQQRVYDSGEDAIEQAFVQSVERYAVLRREATAGLPPLESSYDVEKIQLAVEARAEAIRAVRPTAREGDLFTSAVAAQLCDRIRKSLADEGYTEAATLQIVDEETDLHHLPVLEVNGRFPWEFGSSMFPGVLAALPQLPRGLEYRFIHTDLALVDVDASLIVDLLRGVLRELSYVSSGRDQGRPSAGVESVC